MRATLLGLAVLGMLLSGCGDEDSTTDRSGSEQPELTEPVNPVPILQGIDGCILPPDASLGEYDMNGNRYASCAFMDNAGTSGTDITVRTYPGDPAELDPEGLRPDDSHKKIVGDDFILTITGDFATYSAHIDPAQIAAQVGGEVVG